VLTELVRERDAVETPAARPAHDEISLMRCDIAFVRATPILIQREFVADEGVWDFDVDEILTPDQSRRGSGRAREQPTQEAHQDHAVQR